MKSLVTSFGTHGRFPSGSREKTWACSGSTTSQAAARALLRSRWAKSASSVPTSSGIRREEEASNPDTSVTKRASASSASRLVPRKVRVRYFWRLVIGSIPGLLWWAARGSNPAPWD